DERSLGLGILFRILFQTQGKVVDFGFGTGLAVVIHAVQLAAIPLLESFLAALGAEHLLIAVLERLGVRSKLAAVLVTAGVCIEGRLTPVERARRRGTAR